MSRGLEQRCQDTLFPLRYELLHFRRGVTVVVAMYLLDLVAAHLDGVKRLFRLIGMAQEQDQTLTLCHALCITAHTVVQVFTLLHKILRRGGAHDLQAFAAVTDFLLTTE